MASIKLDKAQLFANLFDDGVYTALYTETTSAAVSAGFGYSNGCPMYALVQSGEALSKKDVVKVVKVLNMAGKTGNPVVTYYNSIGANLAEGLDALVGASTVAKTVANLSGVIPQIAVVAGVCGASAALAASNADICIAVEGCEMFFTPTFTSAANGDKLADAGCATQAQKAGIAHIVAKDLEEANAAVKKMIAILPSNNISGLSSFEYSAPVNTINMAKYDAQNAALAIVDNASEVELLADFGKSVYTALATVAGNVCGIVSTSQGELCSTCVSKTARFVRFCDAFNIPVVTVVNTDGFAKSSTQDVAGGLRNAARLNATYADATTATVCVITGKAVGTTYTTLCNADLTIALDTAVVAPIEPLAAATVLYKEELEKSTNLEKDTAVLAKKYIAEHANADALVAQGLVDISTNTANVYGCVVNAFDMLSSKRAQRMPKKHGNMPL